MKVLVVNLLLVFASGTCTYAQHTTIAFGSCSHEYDSTQMWTEIIAEEPDLFIWTGDIVYGDTQDMNVLKSKYDKQKSRSGYQKLLSQMPVIGIWDDHDYGVNDGGKHYARKKESKALLLEFLEVPRSNPVYDHEGAYSTYTFGEDRQSIKIILLDTRYFRDTLEKSTTDRARYAPNPEGDLLGEEQWTWLENELTSSNAALNIIVSSIQVLADEHGFEKWGNFPKARKRLLKLIEDLQPAPTFLISGDRHIAELSKYPSDKLSYPLFDFTSSGLTHTWRRVWEEPNALREGELIIRKNFGIIEVDWAAPEPRVTFMVKGTGNEVLMKYQHSY